MITDGDYVTLEETKASLKIDSTDVEDDTLIISIISGISKLLQNQIGRNLLASDYTENCKGSNSQYLMLKNYPINSVARIAIDNDEMVLNEITIEEDHGMLYRDNGWAQTGGSNYMHSRVNLPKRNIEVTYNAGFKTIPEDLKLLTICLIKDYYSLSASKGQTIKKYSISDISIEYGNEIALNVTQKMILDSYRRVRF